MSVARPRLASRSMVMKSPHYRFLGGLLLLAACARDDTRPNESAAGSTAASVPGLVITTGERGSTRIIGTDTLSDSARIIAVAPEPDGDAIAFTFADAARGISAGLGILERQRQLPQVIWPDSVGGAWWSGPHELTFVAAIGTRWARVVVDVHAESLRTLDRDPRSIERPEMSEPSPAVRARATAFIDSLRVQPTGQPQQSQLQYVVTSVLMAPRDSVGAFHVIARGASGERVNPAWYAIDLRSGTVQPIDSVVGPAEIMPEGAAAWVDGERFIYAKGPTLHEARVQRTGT